MYTNIELGRKNPSLDTALRIAEVLGQPVEDLFGVGAAHVRQATA
jgi:DNA-binding XRE family transcriptional regulator